MPLNVDNSGNIIQEFDDTNLQAEKWETTNNFIRGRKIQLIVNTEILYWAIITSN